MNVKIRTKMGRLLISMILLFILGSEAYATSLSLPAGPKSSYADLVALFKEWRAFEKPPLKNGAPDYTQSTFEERHPQFIALQKQLLALDWSAWTTEQQVDWHIVWAEMNGYDFNYRVLRPWARDPAFYKSVWMARSDVPAHEGPTHHAVTEFWTYSFPLSPEERKRLLSDLSVIPALNLQARKNLIGNAKDLWVTGIRDIRQQVKDLQSILSIDAIKNDTEFGKGSSYGHSIIRSAY